ncbi:MAG: winged helix-turn-helix transcriptional regulator [Candidatus Nitrosopelagicus sp.]|jgi:predicted transcriptional regulator|nr:winged helix-turn-helix transcriptional regulator [Candidatus Nitrosopelagicus sp.]
MTHGELKICIDCGELDQCCECHKLRLDRDKIISDVIEKNPGIRFNEIMRITDIRNGTLSHYVKKLENKGIIKLQRTPRVTRVYPVGLDEHEAEICKYLTIPTQKKLILFLLKKEVATAIEIKGFLRKSPSVVSVNLSRLFKAKIINKRYDIPSNKYSLKNPREVEGILKEYYPKLLDKLSENTIEIMDF